MTKLDGLDVDVWAFILKIIHSSCQFLLRSNTQTQNQQINIFIFFVKQK